MGTHSSILAWRIPCTEEPGGLQSIGSQRLRHDQDDLAHKHKDNTYKRCTKKGIKACHYKKKKKNTKEDISQEKREKNNYKILQKTISKMAIVNPFLSVL